MKTNKKALLSVGDRIRYNLREWNTELEIINVGYSYYYFKVIQSTFIDHGTIKKRGFINEIDYDIRTGEFIVIKNHGIKRAIKRINRTPAGTKIKE